MVLAIDYYLEPLPEKSLHWLLWYLLLQNGFFCMMCIFLFCVQYCLLLRNLTFKEFYVWFRDWNKGRQTLENSRKFDKGIFANIQQVMGADIFLWGCPWKNLLPTNGHYWP
jgi:hypothetical protein